MGVVTLTYTTTDGTLVGSDPMPANLPAGLETDADPSYFETEGVQRGLLLLNTVLTLKAACEDVYQFGFLSLWVTLIATSWVRLMFSQPG